MALRSGVQVLGLQFYDVGVDAQGQPADYIASISCSYGKLTLTAEEKFT